LIDEETHNTINSPEKLSELCKKYSVNQIKELLSISQSVINKKCREYGIETKKFTSSLENEILEFLDLHKVSYQTHKRDIIYPFEIDIYMPDYNLAIECNGSYWHSELNGKDRNYHLNKTIKSQALGINLIHIWEHEWYQKKDIVKSMLLSRINKATKIYARNCQIAPVETEQEKEFLNNNHIQGYITSFKSIGLYLDNNLVSLMSFGKSRFSKNYEYELLRFCNKADMSVVGGSSKLFQHFVKSAQATSIISYSHRGKFTGNMYKQLGFEYSHSSLPAYYYTQDYETFENRIKYQKHKLSKLLENFDINKTEWQNMQTNGYDRIWDCGNDVWTWSKK
jgi:G:T-mismatch repair DNA endonuclease (very short patch repair protein)